MMLFNEIYGCYYQAVSQIIKSAIAGNLSKENMQNILSEKAFSESFLQIMPALLSHQWPLITDDLGTPIKHVPDTPLTELELRWLKTVSQDSRFKIFGEKPEFLRDVEPLFNSSDYIIFDAYSDGDPYDDPHYIEVFRFLLEAIRTKSRVNIEYHSNKGNYRWYICDPVKLEFSEKDDKFRVHVAGCRYANMLNIAGIKRYELMGPAKASRRETGGVSNAIMACELRDERKALERFLLHFAHFKKEVWEIERGLYRVQIEYNSNDETELLIRILSFGPFVKVISPESFVELIKERLEQQKSCGLK